MVIDRKHIYGESPALLELLRTAELVAATDVSVLITGETGTGKELLAHAIHDNGLRQERTFISLDCTTLTGDVDDSILFGNLEKETAEANPECKGELRCGTLFLDEVGELPLSVQARLLHVLESSVTGKTGYDGRVIAATQHNLELLVAAGRFRKDLFYRLNIVPLELPPLRKRYGDLDILLDSFFRDLVAEHKLPPPNLTKATRNKLVSYPWPGNVRELRNFCERLLILMSGKTVEVTNLPTEITDFHPQKDNKTFELPASGIDINQLECDLIQQALDNTQGNKSHAARLLGLSRDTFLYRLKKYMISG